MQVGSASALNILRNTYSADNLNTPADGTSARLKILQNSAKAQESLRESMTTSAEAAKVRAARKLEEAKQQLEMLKSGGYPPEVVARLAAELAHKISAAAAEFASAVAASATPPRICSQCHRCNRRYRGERDRRYDLCVGDNRNGFFG